MKLRIPIILLVITLMLGQAFTMTGCQLIEDEQQEIRIAFGE
ncbi:hypothetical protein [Natranaerobius thermophilus]|nr:hypothetical protein [Natranaerobius thermophilus]